MIRKQQVNTKPAQPAPLWMRTGHNAAVQLQRIREIVAEAYGCTEAQLRSRNKQQRLAWARHVYLWLSAQTGGISASALGRIVHRHRGCVPHSRRAVEGARSVYPEIRAETDALLAKLYAASGSEGAPPRP